MQFTRTFIPAIIILTTIIALITYKKYRHTPNRYFLYLLLATIITELIGSFIVYCYYYPQSGTTIFAKSIFPDRLFERNSWIYNIFRILTFYFYLFFFKELVKRKKHQTIIYLLFIVYSFLVVLDLWLNKTDFFTRNLMIIRISGTIAILIATILYFTEVFNSNKILKIYKELSFWLVAGSLFYYLLTIPIMMFTKIFYNYQGIYLSILLFSNFILYGSFITGFIINAREIKHG
ncbi:MULTISPECIES: hypothetical protein [Galbibacter]|uniref:Uncharacterized protein n=1 Tax=Galbibacter pacificus TaxID=2996052 RepID=A0ABT6FQ43_9FLAO|nr:hypothetical protein [Galbibacter pacificus]MDG3582153.1 hypothetical protein [Galbibacter pacificus]MDG3585371.1 hypothetical protein [Galbibacter pacificus]